MVTEQSETPLEEIFVSLSRPEDLQLSPDGRRLAYTLTPYALDGDHWTGSIWIAPADGSSQSTQFTYGPGRDSHPRWSPDGKSLAFLSDRAERGTSALYLMSLDGGEASQLVKRKNSISAFEWSPDGRSIAFTASDEPSKEDERRKEERDDANVYGERWEYSRLHLFDLGSGDVRTLPVGDRHVLDFAWSPDSARLAVLSTPTPEIETRGKSEISTVGVDVDQSAFVCSVGSWFVTQLNWSTDGESLLFIRSHEATPSGFAVFAVDPSGGDPTLVAPSKTDDVCGVGIRSVDGSQRALMTVSDRLVTELAWLDTGTGERETLLRLEDGDIAEDFSSVTPFRQSPVLAVIRSSGNEPPEVFAGSPESLRRVSDHQAPLAKFTFGSQEPFYWTASDGLQMDGVLVRPDGAGDGPMPAIVQIHGGPYGRYTLGWDMRAQWLARHGFVVFMPNYRGGEGRGNAFAKWADAGVGEMEFDDIMTGVDALISSGVADPDRLGIWGWSQGGFLTAWAVTQTNRFKAGVMGAGVSDWNMMVMTSDIPTTESMLGGNRPWDGPGPHRSQRHSPISFARNVETPLLILHGQEDARVPVSQAVGFHRALMEIDAEAQLVTYPREPHGIRERHHQLDLLRRIRDWFKDRV